MAMRHVKIGVATAGIKNPTKRIIPAAIDEADDGRPTMECIQPNKKPQAGPKPRRRYAYSPPASGMAAPSSANDSAPKIERIAPTIQAAKTTDTLRPSRAISAGFRKMPVPIMVPTTMATEAQGPRPRTSSRRFSLITLRSRDVGSSVVQEASGAPHELAAGCATTRLTNAPSAKVTHDPIITYQVNATCVKPKTSRTQIRPPNIPTSEPSAFARGSNVPSKNRPSRLPKGSAATVSPASRRWPQGSNPKPISTAPHTRVMRRERCRNVEVSLLSSRKPAKSTTLDAASELSEPLALDMATARIEARRTPVRPLGISRTRNIGRMLSVRSPGVNSGERCANTKSTTPTRRKMTN